MYNNPARLAPVYCTVPSQPGPSGRAADPSRPNHRRMGSIREETISRPGSGSGEFNYLIYINYTVVRCHEWHCMYAECCHDQSVH